MDVRREVETPIYACALEKDMGDGVEVMVARDHHELDVGVRCRPFAEAFVDPLLLVIDVLYAAATQRGNVASEDNHVCAPGIEALKITVQI